MKKFYFLVIALVFVLDLSAQCVVNSNDNSWTQAEVITCLAGCNMNCTIDIQANVSLDETIDLTTFTGLTFTISGTGSLTLNGGSDLLLSATSTLVITSTNVNPLKSNQTAPDPVISIGATNYSQADFAAIEAAGGADANGALPIELASFTSRLNENQVTLDWVTVTEVNNHYIAVEHSLDGRLFEEIGSVMGAGTTHEIHNYQFNHAKPSNGTNYYRLRQVDFDGVATYHPVITIEVSQVEGVDVFPNPAQDMLNIVLPYESTKGNVQILDASGRLLQQHNLQTGVSSIELPITGLASGLYFLKIETANRIESLRFRKD